MLPHDNHCINCFQTICSFGDCPIVKCSLCHVPLHACKKEEHLAEICRRAQVNCPNYENGCRQIIIREKIPAHITKCVASVVVCSRDRCRKLNAKSDKIELKHMGRQNRLIPVEHDDLDVEMAIYDQNLIIESYKSSRAKRVKQRDPLHPAHPLIPLRNMPFDNSLATQGLEDSSEDEMREKREKAKKSRMVFANCFMCQIDPAVQHLHTLGNGMDIEKLKKRRITPQINDTFHENHNLKVSVAVENVPECILKSENVREIKKGSTFFTLKCLKAVKRPEYGNHCLSQHTQSVDQLNEMVLRCPNWTSGCGFIDSRIQLSTGNLKFQPHSSTITHLIPTKTLQNSQPDELTIENLPLWTYELLGRYLPSSALFNLSLTNKKLRQAVFIGCSSLCYIEPVWKKADEKSKWKLDGYVWKVSCTEAPPKLEWNVPVKLSMHIKDCPFFKTSAYEEEMVPVFPKELEKTIWEGFADKLSERLIRMELLHEQEDPED